MNDSVQEKLSDLTFELKKYHKHYRSSFRNAVIFYVFIIIFIFVYATILGYKIQELAEPQTAAALIGSKVIIAPEYGRDLDPVAELLAQSTVKILPMTFQQIGDLTRSEIDRSAEELCQKIEEQYLPVLNKVTANAIHEKKAGMDFEAKLLADLKNQTDHSVFDEYLRKDFIYSIPYFHSYVNYLRKKNIRELSRKEFVERDLLLCWLFLWDEDRYKDTHYAAPLFEITSSAWNAIEETARKNFQEKQPEK